MRVGGGRIIALCEKRESETRIFSHHLRQASTIGPFPLWALVRSFLGLYLFIQFPFFFSALSRTSPLPRQSMVGNNALGYLNPETPWASHSGTQSKTARPRAVSWVLTSVGAGSCYILCWLRSLTALQYFLIFFFGISFLLLFFSHQNKTSRPRSVCTRYYSGALCDFTRNIFISGLFVKVNSGGFFYSVQLESKQVKLCCQLAVFQWWSECTCFWITTQVWNFGGLRVRLGLLIWTT